MNTAHRTGTARTMDLTLLGATFVFAVLWMIPVIWVVAMSLKPNSELMRSTTGFFPIPFTFDNYVNILKLATAAGQIVPDLHDSGRFRTISRLLRLTCLGVETLRTGNLATVSGASLVTMPAVGLARNRVGSALVCPVAAMLALVFLVLPFQSGSLIAFTFNLALLGAALGSLDVGMNAHGLLVEQDETPRDAGGFPSAINRIIG